MIDISENYDIKDLIGYHNIVCAPHMARMTPDGFAIDIYKSRDHKYPEIKSIQMTTAELSTWFKGQIIDYLEKKENNNDN